MNLYRTIVTSGVLLISLTLVFSSIVSAETINTGDASAVTILENQINTNVVNLCNGCTPTPEPTKEPTPTEQQPTNTPTPTTPPSNGGGDGDNGGGGVGGPGEGEKQGVVLGAQTLAATGNFASDLATIQQVLGLTLLSTGLVYGRIIRKKNN